ncbi:hypothetical protein D3C87_1632180 [compost metagenome]
MAFSESIASPLLKTRFTSVRCSIFSTGFEFNKTKSAILPVETLPEIFSLLKILAGLIVADCKTCQLLMPLFFIASSSEIKEVAC